MNISPVLNFPVHALHDFSGQTDRRTERHAYPDRLQYVIARIVEVALGI